MSMRVAGSSLSQIVKECKISKSTASLWTRNIVLTDDIVKSLKLRQHYLPNKMRKQQRQLAQENGFSLVDFADKNSLLSCRGSLYWAEGTKSKNSCCFTNCDCKMVNLFYRFLSDGLSVQDDNIKVHIYLSKESQKSDSDAIGYWEQFIGMASITAVYRNATAKKKKDRYPFGVARVCVFNTELVQCIYGMISRLGGNFNYMA